ncbi:MAG TPA: DUF2321 domain-containing protein [Chitinivibrionales bacterium]|nr:DUF2321 domain-containing protein [Chitinivibrionales bacterium]
MPVFNIVKSRYSDSNGPEWDETLVYENGHIINSLKNQYPANNKKFCEKCGCPALDNCDKRNQPIRENRIGVASGYIRPAFCHNCGNPFKWTQIKIETAIEIASNAERIDETDKEIIKKPFLK